MGDFVSTANMYCAEGMVSKLLWDRVLWELLLYVIRTLVFWGYYKVYTTKMYCVVKGW